MFDNPGLLLKPEMFADVTIRTVAHEETVVVPREAVVRSGTCERVFVVTGPGQFAPRVVRLGVATDDEVAVLSGIEAGDEVVVSAQFLIDSESRLSEAAAKMQAPASAREVPASAMPASDDGSGDAPQSQPPMSMPMPGTDHGTAAPDGSRKSGGASQP